MPPPAKYNLPAVSIHRNISSSAFFHTRINNDVSADVFFYPIEGCPDELGECIGALNSPDGIAAKLLHLLLHYADTTEADWCLALRGDPMKQRRLYLVAYDISNNRVRNTALKACRQFATGGQKSLHECWLSAGEHGELLSILHQIINEASDRITLVRLDARQPTHTLGRGTKPLDPAVIVIS